MNGMGFETFADTVQSHLVPLKILFGEKKLMIRVEWTGGE
jgi:hypothetical protein